MPVIVDRIDLARLRVQPARELDQHKANCTQREEDLHLAGARPLALQNESDRKSGERECCPGKDGKHPCLRRAQIMDSVDVGLDAAKAASRGARWSRVREREGR